MENRPYLLPDTLGKLAGPVTGDDPAERNVMYERVIREATQADDLRSYLNESVLRQVCKEPIYLANQQS
jgi:hypothetical protein